MPNQFFPSNSNNLHNGHPSPEIRPKRKRRFFFWLVLATIVLGVVFLASMALAYKFYSTSKKVIEKNPPASFFQSLRQVASSERKTLRGESGGRINILLLGLAGENYPGENLTDSIIIASVDPKTYKTAMISVPRDFYVQIPDTSSYTKINALYARGVDRNGKATEGIEDLKSALTDITGLPIHYYVALDFDGFKKFIDELGGVKIQVPKDIHDERYPGPNFSYQTFDLKQGLYTFDGETALKYARTRHDEDGDFGRAARQQLILESARSKAFSIGTLLNIPAVNNIMNILGDHLRTDVPLDEMETFLELSKKIDTHLTINKVLDAGKADSLMAVSHVAMGRVRAFILVPRTGSYDEIKDLAKNIFDLELVERKKQAIANEKATVAVVNVSGESGFEKKLNTLITKLGYQVQTEMPATIKSQRPTLRNQTSIIDLTNGLKPFSLEDLSKKFSAEISENTPGNVPPQCQKAYFCLIAGSNLIDSLNYEEGTIEDLENEYDKQIVDEREYIELLKKGTNKKN
ncbi:MAG: LCP family protein [Parcubacteria group bacterium]|jgi:LCP family protein required for cell wall assembly